MTRLFLLVAVAAATAAGAPLARAQSATLAFGGDAMLARLVSRAIVAKGPGWIWGNVLPLLAGADATFVNLECVIATGGEKFPGRVFYFRAVPEAVQALRAAGIDYVSLANNHAMDYGPAALLEGIRRLDAAGIARAGAGRDLAEAERPALVIAGGLKVGVVSFADHYRVYAAGVRRAGTNVVRIETRGPDFERVRRALRRAREAGADLVVFSIHWGPNMRTAPPQEFRRFARAVMDAGADLYHGHSAHVFQGVEVYRGKPILYDTGDLIDDYAVDDDLRNDLQILFLARATRRGVVEIELVPLRIRERTVNLARGEDWSWIASRIRRLCADLGTAVERRGDRLFVRVQP